MIRTTAEAPPLEQNFQASQIVFVFAALLFCLIGIAESSVIQVET